MITSTKRNQNEIEIIKKHKYTYIYVQQNYIKRNKLYNGILLLLTLPFISVKLTLQFEHTHRLSISFWSFCLRAELVLLWMNEWVIQLSCLDRLSTSNSPIITVNASDLSSDHSLELFWITTNKYLSEWKSLNFKWSSDSSNIN